MKALERLKEKFYRNKDKSLDVYNYGKYRVGLTGKEIEDYLRVRANTMNIKRISKQFCKIAGRNTGGVVICEKCGHKESLMYHHDLLRFSDELFLGKKTYFD